MTRCSSVSRHSNPSLDGRRIVSSTAPCALHVRYLVARLYDVVAFLRLDDLVEIAVLCVSVAFGLRCDARERVCNQWLRTSFYVNAFAERCHRWCGGHRHAQDEVRPYATRRGLVVLFHSEPQMQVLILSRDEVSHRRAASHVLHPCDLGEP